MDNNFFIYMQDLGLEKDFVSKINGEIFLIEVKAITRTIKSANTIKKIRTK